MKVRASAWLVALFKVPRFAKTPFLLSFLASVSVALVVLVYYFRIQPEIPLLYSLARPSQHLVAKEWLFLFPILSLLISVSHLIIINTARTYNKLMLSLFCWMTVVIQIMLCLSLARILIITV
ncbi:MAG: hypothetical protein M3Q81_01370 [bacterium]|nr:hypothetical protein [bacterium]